jgi:hypothetical protein
LVGWWISWWMRWSATVSGTRSLPIDHNLELNHKSRVLWINLVDWSQLSQSHISLPIEISSDARLTADEMIPLGGEVDPRVHFRVPVDDILLVRFCISHLKSLSHNLSASRQFFLHCWGWRPRLLDSHSPTELSASLRCTSVISWAFNWYRDLLTRTDFFFYRTRISSTACLTSSEKLSTSRHRTNHSIMSYGSKLPILSWSQGWNPRPWQFFTQFPVLGWEWRSDTSDAVVKNE